MRRDDNKPDHGKEGVGEAAGGSEDRPECEGCEVGVERFQLLNIVEVTSGEGDVPICVDTTVQVLDYAGRQLEGTALINILLAAVDVVGSVFLQAEWDTDEEEFVELVEQLLRASIAEVVVTDVH